MQIFVIDWQDVLVDSSDLPTYLAATYQPLLVSGTSIKTINGQSLLGAGNIAISVDLSGYLPIAGGTMAGNLDMDHYQISNVQAIDSDEITLNGLPVASEQYASNASNLASGTVSDNRLSANVPRLNAASNAFTGNITASLGNGGFVGGSLVVGFGGVSTALLAGGQIQVWEAGVQKEAIVATQGINLASDVAIRVSTTTSSQGSVGTTLSVASAGVWQMGTTSNNALGSLNLANLTASGAIVVAQGTPGSASTSIRNRSFPEFGLSFHNNNRLSLTRNTTPIFEAGQSGSTGYLTLPSNAVFGFANSTTAHSLVAGSVCFSLANSTTMALGNATVGDASGSLNLANLTASGDIVLTGASRTIVIGNSQPFNWIANYNSAASVDLSGNSLVTVRTANAERIRFEAAGITAAVGFNFAPRTKSALLATSATATAGVWRITDSTPAQRLAYPDGTNWRYMSDDTVVT